MINLDSLNRQHATIIEEINSITAEAEKDISSINAAEAALHISKLAGQLKLHLMNEDKFLYPNLLQSSDIEINKMTNQYIIDMGNLAAEYLNYKNTYNTKTKINENIESFIHDTKVTMEALNKRIAKEDNELYRLIAERNL
jgi:hemerythrin-like domain-containing protein